MFKLVKYLFFGKKIFQPLFRKLFLVSLEGMNIGKGGSDMNENGEKFAIKYTLGNITNPIIFDVGAQGGNYSREVLSFTKGKAQIYAFEPNKKDYEKLREGLCEWVHLINCALGDSIGRLTLFSPEHARGLSSFHRKEVGFTESEEVSVRTIDEFCQSGEIKEITLLKLDVEGHELICLKGAQKMLPNIKYIQFEISIASRDARVYFKDIYRFLSDYKIFRILRDGLVEIKDPDKLSEILFTTNYLAVRKN